MKLSSFMTGLCLISTAVQADDTRDTSCRTTQECVEQAKRLRGVVARDETSAMAKET